MSLNIHTACPRVEKSPSLLSETGFLSPGTQHCCYAMSLLAAVFGPLVFKAMPFPRRSCGLWVGLGYWIGPWRQMKEPRRGREEESPHFHTNEQLAPWQPDGTPAVLQPPWGQTRVGAGMGAGKGQARLSSTEGQHLQHISGRMWEQPLSSGTGGLVGNAPWCSSPAPHGFIKAGLMGKIFPIMFSIIDNNIHYSHLLSIYSKAFTYLLKSL